MSVVHLPLHGNAGNRQGPSYFVPIYHLKRGKKEKKKMRKELANPILDRECMKGSNGLLCQFNLRRLAKDKPAVDSCTITTATQELQGCTRNPQVPSVRYVDARAISVVDKGSCLPPQQVGGGDAVVQRMEMKPKNREIEGCHPVVQGFTGSHSSSDPIVMIEHCFVYLAVLYRKKEQVLSSYLNLETGS